MPVGKRGGSYPGERRGGRKKGVEDLRAKVKRLSAAHGVALAEAEHRTPLQFLLGVMNEAEWAKGVTPERFQAAVAAAPYCHARLAGVALQAVPDANAGRSKSMLARLSYQQRKAIEAILLVGRQEPDAADGNGVETDDESVAS